MRVFFFNQIGATSSVDLSSLKPLDRIPLDLNSDPLFGTVLSNDLIDTAANRSVRLGSPHARQIKALQPLYRPADPLVAIACIALLLLARSVPIDQ